MKSLLIGRLIGKLWFLPEAPLHGDVLLIHFPFLIYFLIDQKNNRKKSEDFL